MTAVLKLIIVKYFSSSVHGHLNHGHLKVARWTIKTASINFTNPQKAMCRIFCRCCHYVKINSKYQYWVIYNHACTKQPLRAPCAALKGTPNPMIKSLCKDAGIYSTIYRLIHYLEHTSPYLPIYYICYVVMY